MSVSRLIRVVELRGGKNIADEMFILSRDGRYVINTHEKYINVWDAETGEHVGVWKLRFNLPFPTDMDAIDNMLVAYRGSNIVFLSLSDMVILREIPNAHDTRIFTVRICPDKRYILTASKNDIKIWDLHGGLKWGMSGIKISAGFMTPTFDPEYHVVAYERKKHIYIRDLETNNILAIKKCGGQSYPTVVSKKYNLVVGADVTSIHLYSINPPECIKKISFSEWLLSVRYDLEVDRIVICNGRKVLVVDPRDKSISEIVIDGKDSAIFDAAWVSPKILRLVGWKEWLKLHVYDYEFALL